MALGDITGDGFMQIGGANRPYRIGTRQTAAFCELQEQPYDLQDYNTLLGQVLGNGYDRGVALTARENARLAAVADKLPFDESAWPIPAPVGRKELTATENYQFIYSALVAGALSARLPLDFTPDEVADWMDEADISEVQKPMATHISLLSQRLQRQQARGNAPAPAPKKATRGPKK